MAWKQRKMKKPMEGVSSYGILDDKSLVLGNSPLLMK